MLTEVLQYLQPQRGQVLVDCTVGGAGHASRICQQMGSEGRLICFDQDPAALSTAREVLGQEAELIGVNFRKIGQVLAQIAPEGVDGILFDLGVSSPQLDWTQRGFSYSADAPLDMRMDTTAETTAEDLVNNLSQRELSRIIASFGEERWASRIAQFIVKRRQRKRIQTTTELVEVILAAIPSGARRRGPHPARRTFQALRIAVNDELGALREGLVGAICALKPKGRIVAISYHSLEDRIVKRTFASWAGKGPERVEQPRLELLTKKPLVPTDEEIERNPRARSAKLRSAVCVLKPEEGE
jgi:16S rRNA (cytosine1402-N4)-methyltransferase